MTEPETVEQPPADAPDDLTPEEIEAIHASQADPDTPDPDDTEVG